LVSDTLNDLFFAFGSFARFATVFPDVAIFVKKIVAVLRK